MAKLSVIHPEEREQFVKVSFKVPLTASEMRRLETLCGTGRPLKKEHFARAAILAQIAKEEARRQECHE